MNATPDPRGLRPAEDPTRRLKLLRAVERKLLWLSAWTIHNANHIRPVRDGIVTARAIAEAIGRTTQVWTIRITDERDKLVCLSRITLAVIPAKQA